MKVQTFRSFLERARISEGSMLIDVPGPVSSADGILSTIPSGVATAWTTPIGRVTSRFVSSVFSVSVDGDATIPAHVSPTLSPPEPRAPSPLVSPTPSPPVSPPALSYRSTSNKQNSSSQLCKPVVTGKGFPCVRRLDAANTAATASRVC